MGFKICSNNWTELPNRDHTRTHTHTQASVIHEPVWQLLPISTHRFSPPSATEVRLIIHHLLGTLKTWCDLPLCTKIHPQAQKPKSAWIHLNSAGQWHTENELTCSRTSFLERPPNTRLRRVLLNYGRSLFSPQPINVTQMHMWHT